MQGTTQAYLFVSGILFGVVALIHLARAINNWTFVVGPMTIPVAASWVGFIVTGALCLWAIRLATSR